MSVTIIFKTKKLFKPFEPKNLINTANNISKEL